MDITALLDKEFPFRHAIPSETNHDAFCVHFNHAGVGPWPTRAVEAAHRFAVENNAQSSLRYADWDACVVAVRERLAAMMNAQASEIALTKNTSEGLSIIAAGIDWRAQDNVVVGQQEFPSNRLIWESLRERFGVEIRLVDLYADESPETALMRRVDDNTRLLAVSSIQFASGYRMNLNALGECCRAHRSLFCIDAIQSLGAAPFDARACQADFVCADGHKWLLSPEGTGILYCRHALLETLSLSQYGWRMSAEPYAYESDSWRMADDARRLECGSLNNLGLRAMNAALELFAEVGLDTVYARVAERVNYLRDGVDSALFECITSPAQFGGILTVRPRRGNTKAILARLSQCKILCAYRAGGIRLSPHFYTTREHMDYALRQLHAAAK